MNCAPERDLSETPCDENQAPAPSRGTNGVRRSFSWGKKKKRREKVIPQRGKTEVLTVQLDRQQAARELGLELHAVTGDVIVSYAGDIPEIVAGDCVLAIQGLELLYPGGLEKLEAARQVLQDPYEGDEPADEVEVTIEKYSLRTEVLVRHAALRSTSLDKLGLTLTVDGNHVVICGMEGVAKRSQRIAVGDRLIAINGAVISDLNHAVTLLQTHIDELEVELEMVYGFLPAESHEFDPLLGYFVPRKPASGGGGALGVVKRSLSFGKRRRERGGDKGKDEPPTPRTAESAQGTPRGIPELSTEPQLKLVQKNREGKILVTFKLHQVTGDLIVAMVAEGGPASVAGVEVGDRVLSMQGVIFEDGGDGDLELAKTTLQRSESSPKVEMIVQKHLRTVELEFGQEWVGGPKNKLGLSFYSLPDDTAVRITKITGSAAKSGEFALGDRIVAVNGIRVNHAETLSAHIAEFCKRDESVEFVVALGYAAEEGLWYGGESEQPLEPGEARKVKRSFSFGRKPRH